MWCLCTAHTVRGGLEPLAAPLCPSFDLDGELAASHLASITSSDLAGVASVVNYSKLFVLTLISQRV